MIDNIKMKFLMYISSLWLLFVMLIILYISVPLEFGENSHYVGTWNLISTNVIPLVSIMMLVVSSFFVTTFNYTVSRGMQSYFKIKRVQNKNYEHLTFLTTYILPLIAFNLSEVRFVIMLMLLIFVIGFIYVRTDLFYANPTLALLGYQLYEADVEMRDNKIYENLILICKGNISKESNLEYLRVDERIYFVKEK
ncbi:conserved membrane protein of unknown function [Petrocella atlantisensis]|uniref:Uncharacterized protein n=1 Tax=Petrocella atlantisensis TaxID=2173034 RepID=A0A3P7RZE0_9FIRM|nr:anti-phage protein KwaA [Petrocella atlantisensis]VDN47902.1 conserved membrane protein of unknown function [Petrocella atlantisensis]